MERAQIFTKHQLRLSQCREVTPSLPDWGCAALTRKVLMSVICMVAL